MIRRHTSVGVRCAIVIAATITLAAAPQQRFRSNIDVVTMNVAVRLGGAPVAGLRSEDFAVTDDHILQKVEVTAARDMPADITLLIDTSGSMDGTMDDMRAQVRAVARHIGANDRLRLVTFSGQVREVFGFRSSADELPLDSLVAGGWTALNDALSLALIHQPAPERGHLILVFSDAIDSASTVDLATLEELTRRSEAVMRTFVVIPKPPNVSRRVLPSRERPPMPPAGNISTLTGGEATFMDASDDISDVFKQALDEFRRRYVIRYARQGVNHTGWHAVSVEVKRPGNFEVRTRRGYVQ